MVEMSCHHKFKRLIQKIAYALLRTLQLTLEKRFSINDMAIYGI